jgi:hypothetical protein
MQAVKGHDRLLTVVKIFFWLLLAFLVMEMCRKPLWG